jgi:hypothetical protein
MMMDLWGLMRPTMPMLLWLPLIFMSALFEIAVSPSESRTQSGLTNQWRHDRRKTEFW